MSRHWRLLFDHRFGEAELKVNRLTKTYYCNHSLLPLLLLQTERRFVCAFVGTICTPQFGSQGASFSFVGHSRSYTTQVLSQSSLKGRCDNISVAQLIVPNDL